MYMYGTQQTWLSANPQLLPDPNLRSSARLAEEDALGREPPPSLPRTRDAKRGKALSALTRASAVHAVPIDVRSRMRVVRARVSDPRAERKHLVRLRDRRRHPTRAARRAPRALARARSL